MEFQHITDESFDLVASVPYDFATSVRFLEGFTPAAYSGSDDGTLRLAFPADRTYASAGVRVETLPDGRDGVRVRTFAAENPWAVAEQVARILSLDIDGRGYATVLDRDPRLQRVAESLPGLRPVLFFSPYEAACWAIIGTRIQMRQAAKIRSALAATHGETITIDDVSVEAFPSPVRLLDVTAFPGLTDRKVDWLHGIARAALDGTLDAADLRSRPVTGALEHLQMLAGIGPFGAELILIRGCGTVDVAPGNERRLIAIVSALYGNGLDLTDGELEAIFASWRPFRTWVAVLLRSALEG